MRMTGIKTDTYTIDDKWMVDIQTTETEYMAYIWHEDYGVKNLMFGGLIEQNYYEEFLEIVEANFDDYKAIYIEEVFDNGIEKED